MKICKFWKKPKESHKDRKMGIDIAKPVNVKEEYRKKIAEIDKNIIKIQKSTRTSAPIMTLPHNWLRSKSKLYYNWHLKSYSSKVHWVILAFYLVGIIIATIVAMAPYRVRTGKIEEQVSQAATPSIAGNIYSDEGSHAIGSPTCDGTTADVYVRVNGGAAYTGSCNATTGAYSIAIGTPTSGNPIIVYLHGVTANATLVTLYNSGPITGANLYQNEVIVRHENTGPITNANLDTWDEGNDSSSGDIGFTVASSNLTVSNDRKLFVWASKKYTPGGTITTSTGGSGVGGDFQVGSSATFTIAANALSIAGSYTNSGTYTYSGSQTTTFTSTATGKTLSGTMFNTSKFYNLVFNGVGGAWSFSAAATVANDFTITNGTVTGPSATLSIADNYSNSGTFTHNSGTVTMSAVDAGNTLAGTMTGTSSFYNLTFSGVNGAWALNNDVTIANDLTITNGTVTAPANLLIGGNYSNAGTFTHNSGLVKFTSTAISKTLAGTMTTTSSFNNLTFDGIGGAWSFAANAATVAGSLTITNGTVTAPSTTLIIAVSYSNAGTFTHNSGTVKFTATAGSKTIAGTLTTTSSFYDLIFDGVGGGWAFSNDATVADNLTITNGTVTAPANLLIGGSYSNAGTFTHNSGLVKFTSTAISKTLAGTMTTTSSFYNLTFDGVGGAWSFGANAATVAGAFTVTNGTVTAPSSTLTVTGNFAGGTGFTHNSGTVSLNGAGSSIQIISGNTTFNNLYIVTTAARTISFTSGSVQTVAGTWTATGASNNLLILSPSSSTNWTINPSAATVNYVNVSKSTNTGIGFCANYSTDSSNNVAWSISGAATCATPSNTSLTFTNPYGGSGNIAIDDDISGTGTVWDFQAVVADTQGYNDISTVELHLANSTDSTQPYDSLKYRWTNSGDAFTEITDTQGAATITSTSADSTGSSNSWTLDFKIKFNGNFATLNTDYAMELVTTAYSTNSLTSNYASAYRVQDLGLTFSVDSPTIALGNLLPGSVATSTSILTVTTNYTNGYAIYVKDNVAGGDSALWNSDGVTKIPDYTAPLTTPTLWNGNGLGVCVYLATDKNTSFWGTGSSETDSNNKYAGVPQSNGLIQSKAGAPTVSDVTKVGYKLVVPTTQKTGVYKSDDSTYNYMITYTVVGKLN